MHVETEDQLPAGDVLHLVDERSIAVAGRDPLSLEQAERVRAGRAHAQTVVGGDVADGRAQASELPVGIAGGAADGCRDLERRLHQLRLHPRLVLVADDRRQDGVDALDEVERLRVEEHVLLLDAERVRLTVSERVLEHAARRAEAGGRDRWRPGLLHRPIIASASISTNHRGSKSPATTMPVVAGRTSPNTSPCALPTSSMWSADVT